MPEVKLASAFLKLLVMYASSSLSSLHPYLDVQSSLGNWSSFLSMVGSPVCFQRFY